MASDSLEVVPATNDSVGAIMWLINEGILKNEVLCTECKETMKLKESKKTDDPLSWQCLNKQCSVNQRSDEVSCRAGSYFEGKPPISLAKWINIVKGWCYEETQDKVIIDVGLTDETVPMIYMMCRILCGTILGSDHFQLGSKCNAAIAKKFLIDETSTEDHLLIIVDLFTYPIEGYMQILKPGFKDVDSFYTIVMGVAKAKMVVTEENCAFFFKDKSKQLTDEFIADAKVKLKAYTNSHKDVFKKIKEPGLINPQEYLDEAMWRERIRFERLKTFLKFFTLEFMSKINVLVV